VVPVFHLQFIIFPYSNNPIQLSQPGIIGFIDTSANSVTIENSSFRRIVGFNGPVIGFPLNANHSATIRNCTFDSCHANSLNTGYGGAVWIAGAGWAINTTTPGQLTIDNCTFTNNIAGSNSFGFAGGALFLRGVHADLTNLKFYNNFAAFGFAFSCLFCCECTNIEYSGAIDGGAAQRTGWAGPSAARLTLTNCEFVNNTASTYGGALAFSKTMATLIGCKFIGNRVTNSSTDAKSSGAAMGLIPPPPGPHLLEFEPQGSSN